MRCVVGVIRHGDRTPKQKLKLEVKHPMFFEIFRKYDGFKNKNLKLKKPQQLQEILDVSRQLLEHLNRGSSESELIEEKKSKLEQIKNVLEMYGHFSGINRKVQLKYQPKGRPKNTSSDEGTHACLNVMLCPNLVNALQKPQEKLRCSLSSSGAESSPPRAESRLRSSEGSSDACIPGARVSLPDRHCIFLFLSGRVIEF